ncbi:hypothetical protein Salat_2604400 [Sesamum alatum]|uniref:Myb/SANT-like domain-containing protein n=1 Tax=Sesamum alatum TaxID=300844 RepID=A0AAE1XNY8_9LAMI|nr:hypothetical protein Salat_2604400 [Sesamum alatum]
MDPVWSNVGSAHGTRPDKVVWKPYMEHRFIEFMHEEFISHRLQSSTFSHSVWARICEKMNSAMSPSYVFTTDQLKGKLNILRRVWRLMNDILNRGTGWGWDSERNTIRDDVGRLEDIYRAQHGFTLSYFVNPCFHSMMFARNNASGGLAGSSTNPPRAFHTINVGGDEQITGTSSGGSRSQDDYEDTTVSQSSQIGMPPTNRQFAAYGSKRQARLGARVLQTKKCETMNKLNESLQGKMDRASPKATDAIEHYVNKLTKFKDLPDVIFTTAQERFHSHNTRTIFLRLDDENKLHWLYSLQR